MGSGAGSSPAKQPPPQSSGSRQDRRLPTVPAHAAGAVTGPEHRVSFHDAPKHAPWLQWDSSAFCLRARALRHRALPRRRVSSGGCGALAGSAFSAERCTCRMFHHFKPRQEGRESREKTGESSSPSLRRQAQVYTSQGPRGSAWGHRTRPPDLTLGWVQNDTYRDTSGRINATTFSAAEIKCFLPFGCREKNLKNVGSVLLEQ